jgi:hypothetical protein
MGTSALVAGVTLTTRSFGLPLASVTAWRRLAGARTTTPAGVLAILIGALGLQLLGPERGPALAATTSGVVGVAMGLLRTTFRATIETRVPWNRRGATTSANLCMGLLGNALGAALLGEA